MDTHDEDDAPLDPAEGLAIVAAQRRRVQDADVDDRVLFGTWGALWLVGYAVQWWSAERSPTGTSTAPAGAVFGVLMVVGLVVTLTHVGRRSRGMRGVSRSVGAMIGMTWFTGFMAQALIVAGVVAAGASPELIAVVANGIACLVVGLLYMACGAMWQVRPMYVLGVWIIAAAAAASLVGTPGGYLVMSLAGGGGMLLGAVVAHVARQRA
ncbi:hypothetical protein [Cellulomonas shaoxiangyii]|uniref:Uncharacterized protein n=1 Tax=Cellulomonas shaoxiangyii TaxID=2566013 RepID=A0A4V1CN22_9CELL|nr:hypothetical protein [Cellulomonas shaoxiangyii]QCB94935.1 hypothetical protein E5225_16560 [Cellulomonas shaoxiangyii]TGY84443.1 hypothetical protein E5226_11265 [Cellulomonas shaoxiangyii]